MAGKGGENGGMEGAWIDSTPLTRLDAWRIHVAMTVANLFFAPMYLSLISNQHSIHSRVKSRYNTPFTYFSY